MVVLFCFFHFSVKIYLPPDLPRNYRPVHYFRPVIAAGSENCHLQKVLEESTGKLGSDTAQGRHALNASQRREQLGETVLKGPAPSVLEYLSEKDRERLKEVKQATEQQMKAKMLPQQPRNSRFQPASPNDASQKWQMLLGGQLANAGSSDFKPFARDPEKQKRYESFVKSLKQGEKVDTLERYLDPSMTEWERGREQEEFFRAAMFYKSSNSVLASRFTRAKYEDDVDKVEVPRDQENDIDDKESAVKMKMFGKLTRDKFEWHPEKLLCKRFNVPDPYPESSIVGLPKVKRDKYSVFNFLTLSEPTTSGTQETNERKQEGNSVSKPKKPSRWDISDKEKEKKDSISEFISLARSKADLLQKPSVPTTEESGTKATETLPSEVTSEDKDQEEEEESRPPMDLFKAIFVSSSDEKSSSEEESDEEQQPATSVVDSETTKQAGLPDSSSSNIQDKVAIKAEPGVSSSATSKQEQNDAEEFGPKLPPSFSSGSTWQQETAVPASSPGPSRKEKHKKNREKHRTKRDHKHKKEKKKKHRKHKTKGKHKNKKSEKDSSSDTTDSSDSLSDTDDTNLSPKELLRRLKQLQY